MVPRETDTMDILITGANRGIGKALFKACARRPNHTVIAGVRDPDSESSQALHSVTFGQGSRAILVKIDSASEADFPAAVETLRSQHGIEKLDLVIANAGISKYFGKATETPAQQMLDHFTINAVGPLLLFQATASLLSASLTPKFVAISSGAGSIAGIDKLPIENTAYGSSKTALNFITRRIHFENPHLIAFPINPGWLQTDLGNHAAQSSGLSEAPVAVEDGVNGILNVVDKATREKTSGRFWSWDEQELQW
ncbi:hypothetical protein B0J13DRAFT_40732 [Dactylonectria estremocensis]|uniref:Uncharacterized protein n=1 Tax=Dactylonectria estremocensis TaxID=1079267 RepID=A0A9P9J2T0_9HYPO|nr:hypothetical protein B0J13DRAFT_40732 [Dactylonectria estremocensis]